MPGTAHSLVHAMAWEMFGAVEAKHRLSAFNAYAGEDARFPQNPPEGDGWLGEVGRRLSAIASAAIRKLNA